MPNTSLNTIFTKEQITNAGYFTASVLVVIFIFSLSHKIVDIEEKRALFLEGGTILCFDENSNDAINLTNENALLTQTHDTIIQKPNIKHNLYDCFGIIEPKIKIKN